MLPYLPMISGVSKTGLWAALVFFSILGLIMLVLTTIFYDGSHTKKTYIVIGLLAILLVGAIVTGAILTHRNSGQLQTYYIEDWKQIDLDDVEYKITKITPHTLEIFVPNSVLDRSKVDE